MILGRGSTSAPLGPQLNRSVRPINIMTQKYNDIIQQGIIEIKNRRRWTWIVFFIYIPIVFAMYLITNSEIFAIATAITWMILFAICSIRVAIIRCPRCGKRFHQYRSGILWVSNPWTRKCLHCGLKLK